MSWLTFHLKHREQSIGFFLPGLLSSLFSLGLNCTCCRYMWQSLKRLQKLFVEHSWFFRVLQLESFKFFQFCLQLLSKFYFIWELVLVGGAYGSQRLVRFENVFLWPIELPLKLENHNSLPESLLLAICKVNCLFLNFWLNLLIRTVFLATMKRYLKTLHNLLFFLGMVQSQGFNDCEITVTGWWCLIDFE